MIWTYHHPDIDPVTFDFHNHTVFIGADFIDWNVEAVEWALSVVMPKAG